MACCRKHTGINLSALGCKISGILILAFCIGTVTGLFLPIAAVAIIEALLLIMLAYLCLFKW